MSNFVKTVIDPGGFLTGHPNKQGAADPGGAIFKAATGSDIAQRIADPAGILTDPEAPAIPTTPEPTVLSGAEVDQAAEAAAQAEIAAQSKRRGKRSTILTGGLGIQGSAPTRKPIVLGTVT